MTSLYPHDSQENHAFLSGTPNGNEHASRDEAQMEIALNPLQNPQEDHASSLGGPNKDIPDRKQSLWKRLQSDEHQSCYDVFVMVLMTLLSLLGLFGVSVLFSICWTTTVGITMMKSEMERSGYITYALSKLHFQHYPQSSHLLERWKLFLPQECHEPLNDIARSVHENLSDEHWMDLLTDRTRSPQEVWTRFRDIVPMFDWETQVQTGTGFSVQLFTLDGTLLGDNNKAATFREEHSQVTRQAEFALSVVYGAHAQQRTTQTGFREITATFSWDRPDDPPVVISITRCFEK